MSEALVSAAIIRDIANQIVNETILENWHFYMIFIALSFLASTLGVYLGGYLRKRGETKAIKSDYAEILRQLKESTAITESIKSDINKETVIAIEEIKTTISKADWTEREWRTIRKTKLEELINCAFESVDKIHSQFKSTLYKREEIKEIASFNKFRTISILFFPELCLESGDFAKAFTNLNIFIAEKNAELVKCEVDNLDIKKAYKDVNEEYKKHAESLSKSLNQLTLKSFLLMKELSAI